MSRKLALVVVAIVAAWLYLNVLRQAFGYLPIFILRPGLLHAAKDVGGQSLLRVLVVLSDLLIYAAVSIPFAILFAWLYPRRWLLVAVATSGVVLLANILDSWKVWNEIPMSTWHWTYTSLNSMWLLVALPVLTYLVHKLASNNRLEPQRHE